MSSDEACSYDRAAMTEHASRSIAGRIATSLAILGLCVLPAPAATAAVDPATPQQRCAALRGEDFSTILDAPSRITGAAVTRLASDVPEACQVDGYVLPGVGFRLSLPLEGWNGKLVQGGCGGACGTTRQFWCDQPLRRGFACIATDMGHTGTTADWLWGYNEPGRRADFGHRATHVTLLAGKAIGARYFGREPRRSYFTGCSTGGRQAMMAAQSFPWDYDGIVAGAAPLDETGTALQLAWSVRANLDANGQPILDEPAVRRLHAGVLQACDLADGIRDGNVGDPRRCRFDPATTQCAAGARGAVVDGAASCLTAAQVGAARKLYAGPTTARDGRPIGRQGGVMPGSELWWIRDYVPAADGTPPQYAAFLTDFFRYMAFDPSPGPGFTLDQLDFERDMTRLGVMERVHNATNPDLRAFRDAGGKLIGFQGWGDTSVVPGGFIDYYESVQRTMGGSDATREFFRFYAIPGMRHCSSDGSGGDMVDWLDALDRWVERDEAPTTLLGHNYDWGGPARRMPVFPPDPARVRFTRPVYEYPAVPVYRGQGDPRDAASYRPSVAPPSRETSRGSRRGGP